MENFPKKKGATPMPPLSLLIKPASGGCNMRCVYCFYHDEAQNRAVASYGMMSEDTLELSLIHI